MYEDILDDPEVQELVEKYDSNHQNDVPLDEFGKPLEDDPDDDPDDGEPKDKLDPDDDKDNSDEGKEGKDDKGEDDAKINESSLEEFMEKVPEIDYTPQTEFAKSLDLTKIDDGFQKYVLTHVEPLVLKDSEGKEIRAYTTDDIPKDFKFADQLEVTKASTALSRIEAEGATLRKEYDDALADIERVNGENEARQSQLEGLTESIENGEFPKLELDKNGNIDKDSKVNQLADDILMYQQETNKDRTPSRAISFDTALNRFRKENADRFKDLGGSLSKEDTERANYAARTSRSTQRSGKNSTANPYDNLSREEFDTLLNDPDFDVRKLLK
jgi:hypothetical protein